MKTLVYPIILFFLVIVLFLAGVKAFCAAIFNGAYHQIPIGIICIAIAILCVIHVAKEVDKLTRSNNFYQSRKTWE